MKRVLVPIYLKLVIFVLIIVGSSLSAYVYYSINLFQNDKISYVFETVDDHNLRIVNRAQLKIKTVFDNLTLLPSLNYSSVFIHNWLKSNSDFISYFEGDKEKISKIVTYFKDNILNKDFELAKLNSEDLGIYFFDQYYIFYQKKNNKTYGLLVNKNFIEGQVTSELYNDVFVSEKSLLSKDNTEIIDYIKNENRTGQTFLYGTDDKSIISYRVVNGNLAFLSKADFSKAIKASDILRKNSLYFGLLIAGIVIIGVLLFSKFFTKPITNLLSTVKSFLSSDFQNRAKINTRDEIGVLASSFNYMADDIQKYMSEMKDKVRLEEELKTANIVQSQFFPKKHYPLVIGNIYGFYQSASECGGDWWGVYEGGTTTVMILADVTGHGTPAALLTAILFNTINAIDYLSKSDPKYIRESNEIMAYMNNSIAKASNTLNATAFVLCIDHETKKINYTNASHNPPLYFPLHTGELDKGKLIPLMENNGPRLGENKNQIYEKTNIALQSKDKILFYTDGLTEAENQAGKAYGQRKLIKSLLEKQNKPVSGIIDEVLNEFNEFTQNAQLMDDITFVGLEID